MNLKKIIKKFIFGLIIISIFVICNYSNTQARGPIQQVVESVFTKIKNSQSDLHSIELNCDSWTTDHDMYLQLGKAFKYPVFPILGKIYEYNSFMYHMYVLSEVPQSKIILYLKNFSKFAKTDGFITKKILLNEFKSMIKHWNRGGFTGSTKKSIIVFYN
ncbi:MAG: hypothetical protein LBK29_04075 [Oscillospiraceae bacterium]|jgi:hypothetical protein|nr:hypothetical protein [Oscillospiraceae bacterium]